MLFVEAFGLKVFLFQGNSKLCPAHTVSGKILYHKEKTFFF